MAYRNDLDAAHAQSNALREEVKALREKNDQLRKERKGTASGKAKKPKTHRKAGHRSGFRYERPASFWPMFEDWHEMVEFFSTPDSDSVLAWIGSKVGFLTAMLFFTPHIAVFSILILPFVILSGFKIGGTPKRR